MFLTSSRGKLGDESYYFDLWLSFPQHRSRSRSEVSVVSRSTHIRRSLLGSLLIDSGDVSRAFVSHRVTRSRTGVVDGVGCVVLPVGSARVQIYLCYKV